MHSLALLSLLAVDAPGWFRELASSSLPAYEAKVPAAVLLNEGTVTLDANGRQTRSERFAVRVLTRDGAREARQGIRYNLDSGKVREMKAWLMHPSGNLKEYGKSEVFEANDNDGLYEEAKYRAVDASRDAGPGAVFGFEATVEEKMLSPQFIHFFHDDLPALRSVFVLNLPAGWTAEAKVIRGLNAEPIDAEVNGGSYRWQLTKLPPIDLEAGAPHYFSQNPRLLVSAYPPTGSPFRTWKDIAAWSSQLADPSAALTPELTAKAQELTAGKTAFWDKLTALAQHAQGIRYESVQMNLSSGGGYTPHPAAFVLKKGYGDCKDKANYLKTLLKAVGIDSYLVTINSGDPYWTRKEWPSPKQFNHAVIAIKVPDETQAPAVFDFPGLGKMLMFDPTDHNVSLGYIPDHEQKSWALLLAGDKGDLFQTPATPPSVNHTKRNSVVALTAEGGVKASIEQVAKGQDAFDNRRMLRRLSPADYQKVIEGRVSRAVPGAVFHKIEPKDNAAQFDLTIDFEAVTYGKSMQGRLLMVKPIVLHYNGLPDVSNPKRTQPLILEPASFQERVEMEIPAGFVVDELPDSGAFESEYGKYRASFKAEGNKVIVERELELQAAWVPAEKFAGLRSFIGKIGGSEQAPVVLMRK